MDFPDIFPSQLTQPRGLDRSERWFGVAILLPVLVLMAACGPSMAEITQSKMDRSLQEFQLASALREEGNVPGALDRLEQAITLNPLNAEAYVLKGFIFLEKSELGDAADSLSKGISLLADREGRQSMLAEARNLLGVIRMNQDRYADAAILFEKSAHDILNTTPYLAFNNLGWAHLELGQHEEALEALDQALRLQPRLCIGHFNRGRVLLAQEQFGDAEQAFTMALEADERCQRYYQAAWRRRGETRARLEHREDALHDFQKCVELGESTEDGEVCQRYLEN